MNLSTKSSAVKIAYEKGYRVVGGEMISPITGKPLVLNILSNGYKRFNVKTYKGQRGSTGVPVHRLVAYEKFGDCIFKPGIQVRHLDGDCLNNNHSNIEIGTQSENMMDRPKEKRVALACNAAKHLRKFSDVEVEEIRKFHNRVKSYKQTQEKFGISSKGTLHYILHTT